MNQPVPALDLRQIRAQSWDYVAQANLPVNPHLPLLDQPAVLRPLEAVVDRAVVISVVLSCAYGYPKPRAQRWLAREGLDQGLIDLDLEFMDNRLSNKTLIYDQVEGLWALSWAMGLIEQLDFTRYCDRSLAQHYPELNDHGHRSHVANQALLRPTTELVAACDLAYCLHWAFVEVEGQGQPLDYPIKPFAIAERRRALEWLLYREPWYAPDLST
jgi:hypothetical protein